jgi:Skp family chaperone for outer membrane proteins
VEETVMKNLPAITLILAGACAVVGVSHADAPRGTRDPGVNARQHRQHERITQGVRSGELTRREAGRLAEEQRDVRQLERGYKSDGVLTGAERRDLQHEQNQASRDIYRQKHDEQQRGDGAPGVHDPGVNQRQANQTARIAEGVKSGELTRPEAQELRTERRDIRELEHDYKADGALTKDERQDLHQQLNQQGQEIHEEKHDDERR